MEGQWREAVTVEAEAVYFLVGMILCRETGQYTCTFMCVHGAGISAQTIDA